VDTVTDPPGRALVLGGARSGKSAYAESLLAGEPEVHYVATGPSGEHDPEWRARVERHRRRRPAGWRTVETTEVAAVLTGTPAPLLVDSATLWLTAVLDRAGAWDARPGWEDTVGHQVDGLLDAWRARRARAVVVSDEVGWGIVPETAAGRLFRDRLGLLNQRLAAAADQVWLVVAGLPQRLR
jgi:adenosylcobinamide kinase/adenosylcobinamide-phosphate guanylyltransferase